jgi:hypothetical protein
MPSPRQTHMRRRNGQLLGAAVLLAVFGVAHADHSGTFPDVTTFHTAVNQCTLNVPSGDRCCSSGAADCGAAGIVDMPDWDVSNLQNMAVVFSLQSALNQDISGWDVRHVESMDLMFWAAKTFDDDITGWDTSALISSSKMFWQATAWLEKYERKDGNNVTANDAACLSAVTSGDPGDLSCFDGPPSAWRLKGGAPGALPFPSFPITPPPPRAASDVSSDTKQGLGDGAVVAVAVSVLLVGFGTGYFSHVWRTKAQSSYVLPVPDEEYGRGF